jgi:hypothetical protein
MVAGLGHDGTTDHARCTSMHQALKYTAAQQEECVSKA